MPYEYVGNSAAADFTQPVPIILDGEDFQYGSTGSGLFGMMKPIVDRLARLKAFSGFIGEDNTWSGTNLWNTGSFIFQDTLDHVGLFCSFEVESGGRIDVKSGAAFEVKSGGSFTLDAGAIYSDAGDRTMSGTSTFTGPSIHSGANGRTAIRVTVLGTGATAHADCTSDVWQVDGSLTSGQTVRLDTPTDTTKHWIVTVSRNRGLAGVSAIDVRDDASNDQLCGFLADAYVVTNSTGPVYTGTPTSFAWAEFFWDTGTSKWRLHKGGGGAFDGHTLAGA